MSEDPIEVADKGTWVDAELEGAEYRFAWTLWSVTLTIPEEIEKGEKVAVVCRAGQSLNPLSALC